MNTIVREYVQAGYARLVPGDRGKEREVVLTQAGRDYALPILRPLYAAEERAMARTLERFSPEFLLAVEAMTDFWTRPSGKRSWKTRKRNGNDMDSKELFANTPPGRLFFIGRPARLHRDAGLGPVSAH